MKPPRYTWTAEMDQRLKQLNDQAMPMPKIAKELGVSYFAVNRRLAELEVMPALAKRQHTNVRVAKPKVFCTGASERISEIKAAQRGFKVPREKEPEYFELLKSGLSIAEARKRLGL